MPYVIKEKDGKFHVVDTDTKKIRGSYEDEDKAEDRKDELDFRATVRDRISRMPVAEMTAEEKAAAYDKMIAEKNAAPTDDKHIPPKKEDPPAPEKTPKRSAYWGDALDD